ncbi:MAG TPA: helix-turn-helix domain-containing protein [Solirubrobacterales bacterium]|nr:helix-turn-helix domain-containing protein [Solirubrobacterales bacterium]
MRIAPDDSRIALLAGLRARRLEIDRAILARVQAIGEMGDGADVEYRDGLRRAVESAIEHTVDSIGRSDESPLLVPIPLLAQARLAARRRLPLETMLRRYLAGHAVLIDFVTDEAARQDVLPGLLGPILRSMAARTDLTVAAISSAYEQEQVSKRLASTDRRRSELVRRLLAGELIDPGAIDYDLGFWHLGLILTCAGDADAIQALTRSLDRALLIVEVEADVVWAWLGGRRSFDADELALVEAELDAGASSPVALGEPGAGPHGWRLTHRQAAATLPIARRGDQRILRYGRNALLASALHDELLAISLRELFLAPLSEDRDGGDSARETLRAYFAARRNVSSAAVTLGIDRRTVAHRLRSAEARIGSPLNRCVGELEIALQLDHLDRGRPA